MSGTTKPPRARRQKFTGDSFANFVANVGIGTNNTSSGASYQLNPITRNHVQLEFMYRGSWIVRKTVDCPADDMTRMGADIDDDMPPDRIDEMQAFWKRKQLWKRLNSTLKWARLYGGALAVIMIEGQNLSDPLRLSTVGRGQFQGLLVLDRWMVQPDYSNLVSDPGAPDYGDPKFYNVVADARTLPSMKIHHSRCLRFDGIELPYWQKMTENGWGLSVIEPLYDRLVAFDSTTQGAAQLVYRAYLRTLKLPKLRELIATGGKSYQAVLKQIDMIRVMQANEGLTLLDGEDQLETSQYSFAGLSEMMAQFGQQLSGSADVPLTRMFGQSPSGLNSTGDSDLRNYYDGLRSRQEMDLTEPVRMLYHLTHRTLYGEALPGSFNFSFNPLWQLTDEVKAGIAGQITGAVTTALQDQIIDAVTAARELRQQSRITGVFSNITDAYLKDLENNPPQPQGEGEEPPAPGDYAGEQPPDAGGDLRPQGTPAEQLAALLHGDPSAAEQLATWLAGRKDQPTAAEQLAELLRTRRVDMGTSTRDSYPVHDFHGLKLVIETPRGTRRMGYGWIVQMPCDYGYIAGTNSAEGAREQMDVFAGHDLSAPTVWIIEQKNLGTGAFDEHKVMAGFSNKTDALATYCAAFNDGRGRERIGKVREMPAEKLPEWLANWRYGAVPKLRAVR